MKFRRDRTMRIHSRGILQHEEKLKSLDNAMVDAFAPMVLQYGTPLQR
jgi:hypothetical protein